MAAKDVLARKKAHARSRFDERYGIRLDDNLTKQLIHQIQTRQKAERICFVSHRCSVWSVFVPSDLIKHKIEGAEDGLMVPVVYDKDRKLIVTALPLSCNEMANVPADAEEL